MVTRICLFIYLLYVPIRGHDINATSNVTQFEAHMDEEYDSVVKNYENSSIYALSNPGSNFDGMSLRLPCCNPSDGNEMALPLWLIPTPWICPVDNTSLTNSTRPECCDYWNAYVVLRPSKLTELPAKAFACQPHIQVRQHIEHGGRHFGGRYFQVHLLEWV